MYQYLWVPLGIITVALTLITLIRSFQGKMKHVPSLLFFSFVSSLLFFLSEYYLVLDWVKKEDFSALLDVVPTMGYMLTLFVLGIILINVVSFCLYKKSGKK